MCGNTHWFTGYSFSSDINTLQHNTDFKFNRCCLLSVPALNYDERALSIITSPPTTPYPGIIISKGGFSTMMVGT